MTTEPTYNILELSSPHDTREALSYLAAAQLRDRVYRAWHTTKIVQERIRKAMRLAAALPDSHTTEVVLYLADDDTASCVDVFLRWSPPNTAADTYLPMAAGLPAAIEMATASPQAITKVLRDEQAYLATQ